MNFSEGEILLFNKPLQWTSFDVVKKIKNVITKYQSQNSELGTAKSKLKVGHAGTLDPLATGLLIICTGKATKKIQEIQLQKKEYTGTFFLGATTPSFDKETEVDKTFPVNHITEELIFTTTKKFIGEQQQIPPAHSAVMINGKRAYELARKGIEVEMPTKTISIYEFEITKIEMPLVYFRVMCGKGTYIRSLANDFGAALNSGGYLDSLCRTKTGDYYLKDAFTVEEFCNQFAVENKISKE